ncbi:anhydro-N-acetylmuramic acid kinase [Zavarzinia sp.]|uniref:anhydro-N-acetylmuramic acid kinase n=1 Tax=Zavarzinia sp. TaxID=2027920 RepID=UPI0035698E98
MKALGLMSGTSLDGIDLAVIETDGESIERLGAVATYAHSAETRAAVREASRLVAQWRFGQPVPAAVDEAEALITEAHGAAVERFFYESGMTSRAVDIVGFHGQTVLHRPNERLTWQIGDPQALADRVGLPVVGRFRLADVEAGGQGAPLAPLYHRALAASLPGRQRPLAVLNLGGVGNFTWISERAGEEPLAFDTGPANALIDDWALQHTGIPVDVDGRLAAAGRVDTRVLAELMDNSFFAMEAPKSLDRDHFDLGPLRGLGPADGAAVLTAFTAEAVAVGTKLFPRPVDQVLVTGGGRRNPVLMQMIQDRLGMPVRPVEAVGWRGDSLEAEAFGFLAVRSLKGLPLSVPGTTGVPKPQTGGQLFRPSRMSR